MSMTPGPWEVVTGGCQISIHTKETHDGFRPDLIALVRPGNEADAYAIAAVPEMVDLLREAAPYVSMIDDDMEGADGGEAKRLFDKIIALLRRIEGEETK